MRQSGRDTVNRLQWLLPVAVCRRCMNTVCHIGIAVAIQMQALFQCGFFLKSQIVIPGDG